MSQDPRAVARKLLGGLTCATRAARGGGIVSHHYDVCDDCLKKYCICGQLPPTPSPLTRDGVERECQWLVEEHCSSAAEKWLNTDAALRRTIEQQAQETKRVWALKERHEAGFAETIAQLQAQLAAMTTERDAARTAAREIITKLETERDQANAERQRAVDSLAKYIERVRELEDALQHAQEDF